MMIIKVVVARYGLQSQTQGLSIQAGKGITHFPWVFYPELGLATGRESSPSRSPSVIEKIFDFPFISAVTQGADLLQYLNSPEEVSP